MCKILLFYRKTFLLQNSEVLNLITIPNVLLNSDSDVEREDIEASCKFYAGDWISLKKQFFAEHGSTKGYK